MNVRALTVETVAQNKFAHSPYHGLDVHLANQMVIIQQGDVRRETRPPAAPQSDSRLSCPGFDQSPKYRLQGDLAFH
jgi:hypothetical protein